MTRPTLQQSHGPQYTRILSIGAARGDLVVPNDDLVGPIDSSDEWIRQRTGIITRTPRRRRTSRPSTSPRGVEGGDREGGHRPEADRRRHRLDRSATRCRRRRSRPCSPTASARTPPPRTTSTPPAPATPTAIAQADALIRTGAAHYVLVVGAEKLSDVVDPTDRTISFLLGDGAGAVVIGPSDYPGIAKTVWGSDGSKWDAVGMDSTLDRVPRRRRPSGRRSARTARRSSAGRSGRWRRSPSRRSTRRASRPTTSPRSSRTRRTCASSTSSPSS